MVRLPSPKVLRRKRSWPFSASLRVHPPPQAEVQLRPARSRSLRPARPAVYSVGQLSPKSFRGKKSCSCPASSSEPLTLRQGVAQQGPTLHRPSGQAPAPDAARAASSPYSYRPRRRPPCLVAGPSALCARCFSYARVRLHVLSAGRSDRFAICICRLCRFRSSLTVWAPCCYSCFTSAWSAAGGRNL